MSATESERAVPEATPLQLPTSAIGVPAVLLLGFLTLLGRAGMGIQILGLPLGAYLTPLPSLLMLGLLVSARGRALLRTFERPQRRVAIAVAIAVAIGLLRAAAQGMPTLLRFQDMAYLLHLPWVIVGMAAMRSLADDDERSRLLRWLAWTLVAVMTLHWARDVVAPIGWLFDQIIVTLEGMSDKPALLLMAGDRAMFGLALAVLALLPGERDSTVRWALLVVSGLLVGVQLILEGSRGALLGASIGAVVLLAHRQIPRRERLALSVGMLAAIASTVLLIALSQPTQPTQPFDGVLSEERITSRSGTVQWRLAIWQDVVEEWNASWGSRAVGIGFGVDIAAMTVPGRQGYDGLNRGVHNIGFTVLARQGALGIVVMAAVLGSLALASAASGSAVLGLLIGALLIASFDVFLEGIQAPIFLWVAVGLLVSKRWPSNAVRAEPQSIP